jgi:hypothetical protein
VVGQPSVVAGRPAHVAIAPLLCTKDVVVELKRYIVEGKARKEGEGGRRATNLWPTDHAWPPLNPYFHPPFSSCSYHAHSTHQKASKVKQIPFILFQSSIYLLLLFENFDFILCNDEVKMLWKRSK